jgi:hypothetical protein
MKSVVSPGDIIMWSLPGVKPALTFKVKKVEVFGCRYTITSSRGMVYEIWEHEINNTERFKLTKAQINPKPKKNEPITTGRLKV